MIKKEEFLQEIEKFEKNAISDGTPVLVEHLILKYDKKKLDIKPKYQRIFRWKKEQKSNFIESLILGIPLPGIFVAEDENGNWEVVDGLQRISTILEFTYNKKFLSEYDSGNPESILGGLQEGKNLKSIEGMVWSDLPDKYQNKILDTKIYVSILKNTGDLKSKFELFQRLNTGGTVLSNQEVRNCLLIDKNEDIFDKIKEVSGSEIFGKLIVNIKDEKIEAEQNTELVLRALALLNINLTSNIKIEKLLDDFTYKIVGLSQDLFKTSIDIEKDIVLLDSVIKILSVDSFNKTSKKQFITPLFDSIMSGVPYNIKHGNIDLNNQKNIDFIHSKISEIQLNPEYIEGTKTGKSSPMKLKFANNFGKTYFNPNS